MELTLPPPGADAPGAPQRWIVADAPGEGSPGELLVWGEQGAPASLRLDSNGLVLLPPGARQVRYSYPLSAVVGHRGADMEHGLGSAGAHLLSGTAYLLRPELVPVATQARLRFLEPVPQLPWEPDARGVVHLGWHDLINPGFHTFGGRRSRVELAGGGVVDVAVLAGHTRATDDELRAWVRTAAEEVEALSSGGFPHGRAAVTLVPLDGYARDASPFGEYLSSAPPSVAVFVGDGADAEDLRQDWVLVHELCHSLHPTFLPRQPWLSEGITTWLQQLARMRSGRLSEAAGWSGLVRGSRAGRREAGGETLRALSEGIGRSHAYRAVYWGGALFAVELDLELRRACGKGLPHLLAGLRAAGPTCAREEFAAAIDRQAGRPIAERLLEAHLAGPAFSRLDGLLADLGVASRGGDVVLDDAAPRSPERRGLLIGP